MSENLSEKQVLALARLVALVKFHGDVDSRGDIKLYGHRIPAHKMGVAAAKELGVKKTGKDPHLGFETHRRISVFFRN